MNLQLQERFRSKLQRALQEKGMSQSQLAREMHMSPQAVGQYIHGQRVPGLDLVEKFATALEVEASNLLDEAPLNFLQSIA